MSDTILIIDGGGRGCALAYQYAKSPNISRILLIPGNDLANLGIKKELVCFSDIQTTNVEEIVKIAKKHKVDLVDVAQDDAVAAGLTDVLIENGFKVFGPTKTAGRIEWDKSWSRNFMVKYQLPTPGFELFSNEQEGVAYINSQKNESWYVKASGLAAGKGAIFAGSKEEAIAAIGQMSSFGKSGEHYLIEQCLVGEEFSAFALVRGGEFLIVDYAQDHKKVFDGDKGPNTGGMGCVARPLVINGEVEKQVDEIFRKTANGLVDENAKYCGVLYLGGMVDKDGKVWIIEFNARWGDPEAQVIVPFIKGDYYEIIKGVVSGVLPEKISAPNDYRIVVTVTSKGYPGDYTKVKGREIIGLEDAAKKSLVFGAGVKKAGERFLVSGGRLFYVVESGNDVADARQKAYNTLSSISIDGDNAHFRKDIGWRDLERHYGKKS